MRCLVIIAATLCLGIWGSEALAQNSDKLVAPHKLDTDLLAMVWGDTLKVTIRKVEKDYVTYSLEGERFKQKTKVSNLTAILYKDGRVEHYDNPLDVRKVNSGAAKIKVTYSQEDVQVYRAIAEVEGRYAGSDRYVYTNSFLERMALDNLKEVAFKNDPTVRILLVKKVNITRGYGEGPSAVVQAIAYTR